MIVIVLISTFTLANGVYIIYGTESFAQYLQNIYITSTLAVILIMFVINIGVMPKIFMFIKSLVETINKSKYAVFLFM